MARPYGFRYLTSGQVAAILGVNSKTVARWAKEGKVPHRKTLGGHRRYPEAEIRAIARSLVEPVIKGDAANG